jgi:hypothetical protein
VGAEADCTALWDGHRTRGRAYLETDALIFRGARRLTIPYPKMSEVQAEGGRLTIRYDLGVVVFDLGRDAEKWARRIRNPKSLLDKLGIKDVHRVVVVGLEDPEFRALLEQRAARVSTRLTKDADVVFFGATRTADLRRLARVKDYIEPNGAIWVVRPKGGGAITEADVLAGGKAAGLVDVKVVRFSDTHTAEKFVIPVAQRAGR